MDVIKVITLLLSLEQFCAVGMRVARVAKTQYTFA